MYNEFGSRGLAADKKIANNEKRREREKTINKRNYTGLQLVRQARLANIIYSSAKRKIIIRK